MNPELRTFSDPGAIPATFAEEPEAVVARLADLAVELGRVIAEARRNLPNRARQERLALRVARERASDWMDRQMVMDEFHWSEGLLDKLAPKLTRRMANSKPMFRRTEIERLLEANHLADSFESQ